MELKGYFWLVVLLASLTLTLSNTAAAAGCGSNAAGPSGFCLPRDSNGWSVFAPTAATQLVYISPNGNDQTCGLISASTFADPFDPVLTSPAYRPCRTLAHVRDQIARPNPDRPIWYLLERDGVWSETMGSWEGGLSASQYALIGAYGRGAARPIVEGVNLTKNNALPVGNLVITGVHFRPGVRTGSTGPGAGIALLASGSNLLIEDCKVERYTVNNLDLQSGGTNPFSNVTLYRNIIADAYRLNDRSSGAFVAGLKDVRIEENVFHQNGWNPDFPKVHLFTAPDTQLISEWRKVGSALPLGAFDLIVDATRYTVTGIDLSSVQSFADIATVLQSRTNLALPVGKSVSIRAEYYAKDRYYYFTYNSSLPTGSVEMQPPSATGVTDLSNEFWLYRQASRAYASIFTRNLYFHDHGSNPAMLLGNIFSRGGMEGFQLRPGGTVENNLLVRNAIAGYVGAGHTPPSDATRNIVRRNVVLEGEDHTPEALRGFGLHVMSAPERGSLIEDNIIASKRGLSASGFSILTQENPDDNVSRPASPSDPVPTLWYTNYAGPMADVTVKNNIIYNWNGTLSSRGLHTETAHRSGFELLNNTLQELHSEPDGILVDINEGVARPGSIAGNTYYSSRADAQWFRFSDYGTVVATNNQVSPPTISVAGLRLNQANWHVGLPFIFFTSQWLGGNQLRMNLYDRDLGAVESSSGSGVLTMTTGYCGAGCTLPAIGSPVFIADPFYNLGFRIQKWREFTEVGAISQVINYRDAERDLGSYMAQLKSTGFPSSAPSTYDGFMSAALGLSKKNWHPELTAAYANDYFRQGFAICSGSGCQSGQSSSSISSVGSSSSSSQANSVQASSMQASSMQASSLGGALSSTGSAISSSAASNSSTLSSVSSSISSAVSSSVSSTVSSATSSIGSSSSAGPDGDGDGVSNSQEEIDDTDMLDGGSFVERIKSPAFLKYNTYLDMFVFAELTAIGEVPVDGSMTFYDWNGVVLDKRRIHLPAGSQQDIDIHSLVGPDKYGMIRIDFDDSSGAMLQGRTMHYRPRTMNGQVISSEPVYALARPIRNPLTRTSFATSNSMNPRHNNIPVFNWAEIVNLEDSARAFTFSLYDLAGNLIHQQTIIVPPQGERDSAAGHQFGEGVFLAKFESQIPGTRYLASVGRYHPATEIGGGFEYSTAVSVEARVGTGDRLNAFISNRRSGSGVGACWKQLNWLEIANTLPVAVSVAVRMRNSAGEDLRGGEIVRELRPFEQLHLPASEFLDNEQFGVAQVSSNHREALIVQSAIYYFDCNTTELETAYSSPARIATYGPHNSSYNSFLRMGNVVQVFNPEGYPVSVTDTIATIINGEPGIVAQNQNTLEANSCSALSSLGQQTYHAPFNLLVPIDSYGTINLATPPRRKLFAEVLRVKETNGRMAYAVPLSFQ